MELYHLLSALCLHGLRGDVTRTLPNNELPQSASLNSFDLIIKRKDACLLH